MESENGAERHQIEWFLGNWFVTKAKFSAVKSRNDRIWPMHYHMQFVFGCICVVKWPGFEERERFVCQAIYKEVMRISSECAVR